MRYLHLSDWEVLTLQEGQCKAPNPVFRQRCTCLLMSHQRLSISFLANFFHTRPHTIRTWFDRYETMGLVGLRVLPGRGRKPRLQAHHAPMVGQMVAQNRQDLRKASEQISEQLQQPVSKGQLLAFLKIKLAWRWRRFRRGLKHRQDPQVYAQKAAQLRQWLAIAAQNPRLRVVFGDESGFSLVPAVPYGWQAPGERYELPSRRSSSQSVFGLLSNHHELWTYFAQGRIDSRFIIDCLKEFVCQLKALTLLVLDNASIHTAKALQAYRQQWEQQGLFIFYLPTYAPHLNRIERLWQRVKYRWLQVSDYASVDALRQALARIFANFGKEYNIVFDQCKTSFNYS